MHRTLALLAPVLSLIAGCNNVPTFPVYGDDAGIECGEEGLTCPSGEVCLQSHCYAMCTATSCGPLETCTMGVCVPRMLGTDAGSDTPPQDVPPDPCMDVTCTGATPYCRRGVCVPCTEVPSEEQCGAGTPICLVARNTCVAFAAGGTCEPCNDSTDCAGGRTCTALGDTALERVCLPSCMGGCPRGTECDAGLSLCRPAAAATCFHFRAVGATCTADSDCAPNGATIDDGLFVGACAGTCRYPCGLPSDCPVGTCNSSTGFCE